MHSSNRVIYTTHTLIFASICTLTIHQITKQLGVCIQCIQGFRKQYSMNSCTALHLSDTYYMQCHNKHTYTRHVSNATELHSIVSV